MQGQVFGRMPLALVMGRESHFAPHLDNLCDCRPAGAHPFNRTGGYPCPKPQPGSSRVHAESASCRAVVSAAARVVADSYGFVLWWVCSGTWQSPDEPNTIFSVPSEFFETGT